MAFQLPVQRSQSSIAINQHLVPQVYMRKWKHNISRRYHRVWLYDKTNKRFKSVEVQDIFFEEHFYDIKIGCNFIPDEALEDLFGCLRDYEIVFREKRLVTLRDFSDNFFEYADWEIKDSHGVLASDIEKQQLKRILKSNRYTYIETAWWQYENDWKSFIEDIEERVDKIKNGETNCKFKLEDVFSIMKYLTIYDMRNKESNGIIDHIMEQTYKQFVPGEMLECEIECEDRTHDYLDTMYKQWIHDSKIKGLYEYLKDDKGKYKEGLNVYCSNMSICFWCTTVNMPFLTCETPSMIIKNSEGYYEHIFVATPTLLISLGKTDDTSKFWIYDCTQDDVQRYNRYIVKNSNKIISYKKQEDIDALSNIQ